MTDPNVYVYNSGDVEIVDPLTQEKELERVKRNEDYKRIAKAFGLSVGTFWGSFIVLHFWFAPTWWFWFVVLLAFILAMLTLGAGDAATKQKTNLGFSVLLFIVVQAIFLLVYHYGDKNRTDSDTKKDPIENVLPDQGAGEKISNFATLYNGQHVFNLEAGEETPWFGFEQNKIVDYKISSPSYDYEILVSDGTVYRGGSDESGNALPEKKHCYYKIKANSKQFVTVMVGS